MDNAKEAQRLTGKQIFEAVLYLQHIKLNKDYLPADGTLHAAFASAQANFDDIEKMNMWFKGNSPYISMLDFIVGEYSNIKINRQEETLKVKELSSTLVTGKQVPVYRLIKKPEGRLEEIAKYICDRINKN